ncbi:MAG: hypothetical protein KGL39_26190 [Patescibacteria group bacterium]|nr:hypothetical protein [Patescibacteria group bacterium]
MDVTYDAVLGVGNALKQVRRTSFQPGIRQGVGRMSGAVDPSILFVNGGEPRATLQSGDVAGVITLLSVTAGLFVSAGTITLPWNRRANGGTFAGGLNNFTITGANALIVPRSFSASQSDEEGASAELEVVFVSTDGLTAPVTFAVNQALAAEAFNLLFAMGPVYINTVALTQVQSVKVDTGITVETKMFDGAIYPTLVYIKTREPSITVTFENFDVAQTYAPLFAACTAAAAYFRKRATGGTFVSDATAGHVKLSIATGLGVLEHIESSKNENGTASIKLTGLSLSSSTASAIGA